MSTLPMNCLCQGSKADYRGFVLGVIGDRNAPLNKVCDVESSSISSSPGMKSGSPESAASRNCHEVVTTLPWRLVSDVPSRLHKKCG